MCGAALRRTVGIPTIKALYTLTKTSKRLHSYKVYLNDMEFDNTIFTGIEPAWLICFTAFGNTVFENHCVKLYTSLADDPESLYHPPQLTPEHMCHKYCDSIIDIYDFGCFLALAGHYCRLEPKRLVGELCLGRIPVSQWSFPHCVQQRGIWSDI